MIAKAEAGTVLVFTLECSYQMGREERNCAYRGQWLAGGTMHNADRRVSLIMERFIPICPKLVASGLQTKRCKSGVSSLLSIPY